MKLINHTASVNPHYNLAMEEYILKNLTDDVFMLWQNDNTIVIGRNQNALEEINSDYVRQNHIVVARRMSGGGAVYHDLGNLNFSFAVRNQTGTYFDFQTFAQPVIALLAELGVHAELSGRNDLTIEGKKISGNAQYIYKDRILHHGTLLFSSDLGKIGGALTVSKQKIESKGIKSVQSRVGNITDWLAEKIDINSFRNRFIDYMYAQNPQMQEYALTKGDLEGVEALYQEKYCTWEWNFGYSPKYTFQKSAKFPAGLITVELNVSNSGVIEYAKFYGDFFSARDIIEVEKVLSGIHHKEMEVRHALSKIKLEDYFYNISLEDIISLMF